MSERFDLGRDAIEIWPKFDDPTIRYMGHFSGYGGLHVEVRDMWLEAARGSRHHKVRGDYGDFKACWKWLDSGARRFFIECEPRGLHFGACIRGFVREKDMERFIATLEKCFTREEGDDEQSPGRVR